MKAITRTQLFFTVAAVLFAFMLFVNPFAVNTNATKVLAIGVFMITLWVTETLPMPVVALIPIVLFPLMGICKVDGSIFRAVVCKSRRFRGSS